MVKLSSKNWYDEIAGRYDDKYHRPIDKVRIWQTTCFLIKYGKIHKESVVLSVGCGTGIRELLINCDRLVCLDLSKEMLEIAKKRNLTVVQGTVYNLPFPDDTFDCVFSINCSVFHSSQNMRVAALREMKRVTRKEGQIVTMTVNALNRRVDGFIRHGNPNFGQFRAKNSDVKKAFIDNDIDIEKCFCIQQPKISSGKLNVILIKMHLDFFGYWFVCCGKK